ncbi:MAG TPA: MtnX-like HAD-IB family phosphatase [Symbiobacteriaceae bacterium]|nr:MtnX-like HAD-IB family phosphatase [Symbiobacteriaceae bacterium]
MRAATEAFWSGVSQAPLVVLSDFDFTISQVDVGDLVVEELCPPSEETRRRFRTGEVGSRIFWLDSMARADMARAEELAGSVAVDPHFPGFVRWCRAQGIPAAVVSDGFWFYIDRILGREGLGELPVFCNEMPGPGRLEFPHGNPACDRCGCCKAAVAKRARESGARVVYIGDGTSDTYAAAFADWVFAKDHLARHLAAHGSPFFPFESFVDVQRVLAAGLKGFRAGTVPGRATLVPSAYCRF